MKSLLYNPYLRLMRLHQPTGIWLLLWPCWWSIALASAPALSSPYLLGLFALGAVVMRGAGCIINDLADRDFDKAVERTRTRPLASGEITPRRAVALLIVLLLLALLIALQLPRIVLWLAIGSLPLVALYPFMKRITWWPQLFLGLAFNWGAWMGWAAVREGIDWPAACLYVGGIFWTLGFDTIYAHQDKRDDARVGVKSTARLLGGRSKRWVAGFYLAALAGFGAAGYLTQLAWFYYGGLAVLAYVFLWQIRTVDLDNPTSCQRAFRSNAWAGWILFFAIALAGTLQSPIWRRFAALL